MLHQRAFGMAGLGLAALCGAILAADGCSSDSSPPPATGGSAGSGTGGSGTGTGGSGGRGGTGGSGTGTGGSGGGTSDGGVCPPVPVLACTAIPPPAGVLISDFSAPEAGLPMNDAGMVLAACDGLTGGVVFGTYGADLYGGTYVYPNACPDGCTGAPSTNQYTLTQDQTAGNWHISGNVGTYSGAGLWINRKTGPGDTIYTFAYTGLPSHLIDASAYTGITFTISGNAGPAGTVNFEADSAAKHLNPDTLGIANCGACTGTCAPTSVVVPVTSTATVVTKTWADLGVADPGAFMGIRWVLNNPVGVGTAAVVPYAIDLTIDDIAFTP